MGTGGAGMMPWTLGFSFDELSPAANIAIPLLGVLLITVGMLMGVRKKRRRPGVSTSAHEHVEELRHKQAVRGDLEQLMIEVEQLAKRFGTQLDAKTMQMEHLLEEAEQKIAELKKLQRLEQSRLDAADLQSPHTTPNPPPSPIPQPPSLDPDTVLKQSVCDLADAGHDPVEIARRLDEHVGKVELILALRKT